MSKRRYLLPLIPVAGVFALLAASASANAPSASVSFAGNATLVTDPGPVNVPMHYTCAPPDPGALLVILDENGVESSNQVPATCDGQNHSVTVQVPGAFTAGTATGQAAVSNADASSETIDFGSKVAINR